MDGLPGRRISGVMAMDCRIFPFPVFFCTKLPALADDPDATAVWRDFIGRGLVPAWSNVARLSPATVRVWP
jgi:hypothetical protein